MPRIAQIDGAERALDIADMGEIQNGIASGIVHNLGVENKVGHGPGFPNKPAGAACGGWIFRR
jgi:hypothetical protein